VLLVILWCDAMICSGGESVLGGGGDDQQGQQDSRGSRWSADRTLKVGGAALAGRYPICHDQNRR
jgi:hypothetical protein